VFFFHRNERLRAGFKRHKKADSNERLRAGFKRHKKADSAVRFFIMAGAETRHRHA
jgi:hypothetical protein